MSRFRSAKRGQSFRHANRLLAIENDVLSIKFEVERRWPELEICYDEVDSQWVVIEHCADGIDRLVFTCHELDQRIIDRLYQADQRAPDYSDFLDRIDNANAEVERDKERRFSDQIGDFGERFVHALRKDGVLNHVDVFGNR